MPENKRMPNELQRTFEHVIEVAIRALLVPKPDRSLFIYLQVRKRRDLFKAAVLASIPAERFSISRYLLVRRKVKDAVGAAIRLAHAVVRSQSESAGR